MRPLFDLTGKVVLVTGGNSGLGLGFAQGCARQGADIIVWGRRAENNEAAAEKLRSMGAPNVYCDTIDVSVEEQVVEGVKRAVERAGRIDCAFANAGILSVAKSFVDMTTKMYHGMLDVAQHGGFYTLREVARHMRDRATNGDPGGSLVICGSLSIFAGFRGLQHYGAAKGALAAMMKGIALEMGQYGVRANLVAFGVFPTNIATGLDMGDGAKVLQHEIEATPMGRVGKLSDVHAIAAYLASDDSTFHSGDIITVDGGRMINLN